MRPTLRVITRARAVAKKAYNTFMARGLKLESIGHGENYQPMFRAWAKGTRQVQRALGLSGENRVSANTRARTFHNITLTWLASIKRQGGKIFTDDVAAAKSNTGLTLGMQKLVPQHARLEDKGGNLFLFTKNTLAIDRARELIEQVHENSYFVIDAEKILGGDSRSNSVKQKIRDLLKHADAHGKRVAVIHSAPGEDGAQATVIAYSKLLSKEKEKPEDNGGEGALHDTLAGPTNVIKEYHRFLKNPKKFKPREDEIIHPGTPEWEKYQTRFRELVGQNALLLPTNAGFGGDQIGLLAKLAYAHEGGQTGIDVIHKGLDYWRIAAEVAGSHNLGQILHWPGNGMAPDIAEIRRIMQERPQALQYLADPTNPEAAQYIQKILSQIMNWTTAQGLFLHDKTLVDPNTTSATRLAEIGKMLAQANTLQTPYARIVSASKATAEPHKKIGAIIANATARKLFERFQTPVTRSEMENLFDFLEGRREKDEVKIREKIRKTVDAVRRECAKPDSYLTLAEPQAEHLEHWLGSSFVSQEALREIVNDAQTAAKLPPEYADVKNFGIMLEKMIKDPQERKRRAKQYANVFRIAPSDTWRMPLNTTVFTVRKLNKRIKRAARDQYKKQHSANWREEYARHLRELAATNARKREALAAA